jgi:hypothetical protein
MAAQVEKIAGKNNAMEIFSPHFSVESARIKRPGSSRSRFLAPPPKNRVLAVTEKNEPTFHPNA